MKNQYKGALAVSIVFGFLLLQLTACGAQGFGAAGAMKGHHLYNLQGQELGRIAAVTFDEFGQPAFIIITVTGRNKIVPIPFSALQPSSSPDRYVVNIPQDQVLNAPGYSINALSNF
jgi:hypothetical protein